MTIVRSLNSQGDWTFGTSLNNYVSANNAIIQNIKTRLLEFIGDCFFNITAGIDWLTFLGGSKNQLALNLTISSVILNTQDVIGLKNLSVTLTNRNFNVNYQVQTIYSITNASFEYSLGV
jgi:hypothetical protein